VSAIDAFTGLTGNQAYFYNGTTGFAPGGTARGELRWQIVAPNTQVQTDSNNDGGVDLRILLAGAPSGLTTANFVL
jgi:hypothetical protein